MADFAVRRFTCGLIYYALALNTAELHGSVYVNTFISGAVEIPAYIACIFLMNCKLIGRRWSGILGLTGAGFVSFVCIPLIIFSQCRTVHVYCRGSDGSIVFRIVASCCQHDNS